MKDRPIRVLAFAGRLVVLLLPSVLAARPDPALPAEMPASERSRLALVTATASLATHAAGEPFVARREVFEYLLDHPEFAAHLTRTLRIARYRIWREPDGLWLDDGRGTVRRVAVRYRGNGTRVMHARGGYNHWLLPSIRGQAVVVIRDGVQPAADGKRLIRAPGTGFVKLENPPVEMASKLLSRDRKSTRLNSSHLVISY